MKELKQLGLNDKEVKIYMYLISYGISAASEISNHVRIPKSTVNFSADNLWKRWLLKKSFRTKTWYYEADISVFESKICEELNKKQRDIERQKSVLKDIIPVISDINKNIMSGPKITFLEGFDSCKSEYNNILHMKGEVFYEFWAHKDLESAFTPEYMNGFIGNRKKKRIFCKAIGTQEIRMQQIQSNDEKHLRDLRIIDNNIGEISSTIVIYDNKVLILNLKWIYKWVLIENEDLAETMKTIFRICKN